MTSIGNGVFHGCTGLASVTLPESLTTIYGASFSGCEGLKSVKLLSAEPPWISGDSVMLGQEYLLEHAFPFPGTYPIYVPANSLDTYKSAWGDYSYRLKTIQE